MAILKNFQQFVNENMAQMSNEQHEDTWREHNSGKVSNCCSAPVVYPGICAACGEHADKVEDLGMVSEKKKAKADEKTSRKEVLKDADEKYPNLKKASMKKGLSNMKGKDFKEKAKKNFAWADKPEAAAAAYMRKATGKEPRDI